MISKKIKYCRYVIIMLSNKKLGWIRYFLFFILIQLSSFSCYSQLYFSGEFNFPVFAANLNLVEYESDYSNNNYDYTNRNLNLKAADNFSFSGDIGYQVTNHIRIESEIEYYQNEFDWTNRTFGLGAADNPYEYNRNYDRKYSGIFFRPGIVLCLDNSKIVNPFIKFGVVIANIERTGETKYERMYYYNEPYEEVEKYEIHYDLHFGFTSSIGVEFNISKFIAPYIEIKSDLISVSPTSFNLTKWYNNNEGDLYSTATEQQKTIEYVEDYNTDNLEENRPDKSLKFYEPFSRVSASAGIRVFIKSK